MTDTHPFRKDFPALQTDIDGQSIVYLDSAATALKPRAVIDALTDYYAHNGANIHRGKHRLSEDASDAFEASRVAIAGYIGVAANEVVFTRNTTHALNLVAAGLGLSADDEVVGCMDAHHSQILPWRRAGRLSVARVDAHGRLDREHFRELLRTRPKVVALTHCSNVTGVMHPVAALVREVREACDAVIVLDAAQSLPHERIDAAALDVDFMAFSAHKMLGPTGLGCLYGRAARLAALRPMEVGGGMVDWVDADGSVERRIPHKFEAGTPAIASVIAMQAVIRYLRESDTPERHRRDREVCAALVEGALARPYLTLIGPHDIEARQPIATLRLKNGLPAGELARLLSDSYGIMCRSGHLCAQPLVTALAGGETLRASAYLYNDVDEVGRLYAALDELVNWMGVAA